LAELFASGLILDVIIGLVVAEGLLLVAYHRVTGRGPLPADTLSNLAAGLCLMLALRAALVDAHWGWIGLWLFGSLIAHFVDLGRRWRR